MLLYCGERFGRAPLGKQDQRRTGEEAPQQADGQAVDVEEGGDSDDPVVGRQFDRIRRPGGSRQEIAVAEFNSLRLAARAEV